MPTEQTDWDCDQHWRLAYMDCEHLFDVNAGQPDCESIDECARRLVPEHCREPHTARR